MTSRLGNEQGIDEMVRLYAVVTLTIVAFLLCGATMVLIALECTHRY